VCGIVATITPRTGGRLVHRGPDATGSAGLVLPWASVSVEMTRLAVVDRRPIPVPFDFRASCGVVLAFNGEVYNWRDLRAALFGGTAWETDCDAEVVARAWRQWGPGMLDRMNGMWGLALVDTRLGEMFLARDRAGEKPLYYAPIGRGLAFASEIKALPIRLEETPCPDVDVFEFDCLESTPFRGVQRLGPGQYLHLRDVCDLDRPVPVTWWRLGAEISEDMTWGRAVDETEALLVDAIRLRAVSEVPIGVQLSGGLDSAIVQAVARSNKLYTVTFPDDGVDNLSLARAASHGIADPAPVTFGLADLEAWLSQVAWHLDTPATWSAVCQWAMNKRMAEDGVVVVLSGEGADELFAGYSRYRLLYWLDRAAQDERLAGYRYARERLHGDGDEIIARMLDRSPRQSAQSRALDIVRRFRVEGADLVANATRVEFHTTMQVLLRMADAMAAAHSLENRAVFFDYRLMNLAARMPSRFKITERESKAVLMEVARRLGVPAAVVDQSTKKGLFVPWAKWTGARDWDRSSFATMMKTAWQAALLANEQPQNACAV